MSPAQPWPWTFGSSRPPGQAGCPGATLCEGDGWGELIFNFFFPGFSFFSLTYQIWDGELAVCICHTDTRCHIYTLS